MYSTVEYKHEIHLSLPFDHTLSLSDRSKKSEEAIAYLGEFLGGLLHSIGEGARQQALAEGLRIGIACTAVDIDLEREHDEPQGKPGEVKKGSVLC
jgi:hypothetical protein